MILRALAICLACASFSAANAQDVEVKQGATTARFEGATTRYGHNVLGDLPEWSRLCLYHNRKGACVTLPQSSVFEDIAPRLADFTQDGVAEAVVVESSIAGGASLVIYTLTPNGLDRIATPPIGRRNRWLAPIGISDFDADGRLDISYIETPHLGKKLMLWSFDGKVLELQGELSGFSNHRIGERGIASGIRTCGGVSEMIVPDATYQNVMAIRFTGTEFQVAQLGPFSGPSSIETYLSC
jgi:hypothetical protein